MQFLIKHTAANGKRSRFVVPARTQQEAETRAERIAGPGRAGVCLCINRMTPAQRRQYGV